MSKNGVWIATMETEHYTWTAIGKTQDEAIEAIVNEWQNGVGCENRVDMTREELEDYYGFNYEFIEFGQCKWR